MFQKCLGLAFSFLGLMATAHAGLEASVPKPISNQEITVPAEMTSAGKPHTYTDCVETSILRFLQAVGMDLENPRYVSLTRLRELGAAPKTLAFFTKYPRIEHRPYYKTPAGRAMRNEWALLLVQLPNPNVIYVHADRLEVEANVQNFFLILNDLFPAFHPAVAAQDSLHDSFRSVSDYFSRPGLTVSCLLDHHFETAMKDRKDWTYRETLFYVLFNGVRTYEWIYYEFINPVGITDDAHSEISDFRSRRRFSEPLARAQ